MRLLGILLLLTGFSFAGKIDNSFITKFEYGKMLYENPRGIGCSKCHGDDAKGASIATFKHIKNKRTYNCNAVGGNITDVTYEDFLKRLDPKIKRRKPEHIKKDVCKNLLFGNIMPTYFLTVEELDSIYHYIKNIEK